MKLFVLGAAALALAGCASPRLEPSVYVLTYIRPEPGLMVCGSYVGSPVKTAGEPGSKVFVAVRRAYGTEILQMVRHQAVIAIDESAEQPSVREEKGKNGSLFVFTFTTAADAANSAFCLTGE